MHQTMITGDSLYRCEILITSNQIKPFGAFVLYTSLSSATYCQDRAFP